MSVPKVRREEIIRQVLSQMFTVQHKLTEADSELLKNLGGIIENWMVTLEEAIGEMFEVRVDEKSLLFDALSDIMKDIEPVSNKSNYEKVK